jgi:hypothetical protein
MKDIFKIAVGVALGIILGTVLLSLINILWYLTYR